MKITKTKILIKSFLFLIIFAFSLKVFAIWAPPSNSNPTSSNPFPPLNVTQAPQQKIGVLAIGQAQHFNGPSFTSLGSVILNGRLKIFPIPEDITKTYVFTKREFSTVGVWEEILTGNNIQNETPSWEVANNIVSLNNLGDSLKIDSLSSIYKRPDSSQPNNNKLFIHTTGVDGGEEEPGHYYNIFFGREAGNYSNDPSELAGVYGNTGLGFQVLHELDDDDNAEEINDNGDGRADHNTALGYQALYSDTIGSGNTAIGASALKNNTTGNYNTAVGYKALETLVSGYNNTVVGNNSNMTTTSSHNNSIIGDDITIPSNTNNIMVFGGPSITKWSFGGATVGVDELWRVGTNNNNGNGARLLNTGQWVGPSDRNKKHEIVDLSYGLNEVMKLRPVDFKWNGTNAKDFGFIAQEVKEIIPEVVAGEEGKMGISYQKINVLLVKAIQEQQEEIKKYKDEFNSLKERLEKLQNE